MKQFTLVGGPQDGALVPAIGAEIPETIFVHGQWMGDGYATWSRERSDRFTTRYDKDGSSFQYIPS